MLCMHYAITNIFILGGEGVIPLLPSKMDFKSDCLEETHWIILIVSILIPVFVFAVYSFIQHLWKVYYVLQKVVGGGRQKNINEET